MKQQLIDHGALPPHEPRVSKGDPVLLEALERHVERGVGPISGVIPDSDSRWVNVGLFLVPCGPNRPVTVVCTGGMSERPLTLFTGERVWTELFVVLPASWPTTTPNLGRPEHFWPLSFLRWIARFPHQTGRGFRARESLGPIPHAPPRATVFDAALLLEQPLLPPLAMVGREVQFLAVCPIHLDELEWIRAEGSQVLLDAFAARGAEPLIIDPARPSFAPARPAAG